MNNIYNMFYDFVFGVCSPDIDYLRDELSKLGYDPTEIFGKIIVEFDKIEVSPGVKMEDLKGGGNV